MIFNLSSFFYNPLFDFVPNVTFFNLTEVSSFLSKMHLPDRHLFPSFLPTISLIVSFFLILIYLTFCLMQTLLLPTAGVVVAVTEQPFPIMGVQCLLVYYFRN